MIKIKEEKDRHGWKTMESKKAQAEKDLRKGRKKNGERKLE